jgi:hypothetical protein
MLERRSYMKSRWLRNSTCQPCASSDTYVEAEEKM